MVLWVGPGLASAVGAVDWSTVPASQIAVFHPGQGSYEWMLTERDHSGGPKIREGKNCLECHQGEEAKIGKLIASGEKLEPTPGKVAVGSSVVAAQFAVEGDRFAARFTWPAEGEGRSRSDLAFLFDDGSVSATTLTGCWATCHADLIGMAHDGGQELTKYLTQSRTKVTRSGGGDRLQPAARLQELAGQGIFLEYWRAALATGAPPEPHDGYVLDARHENEAALIRAEGGQSNGVWEVVLSRPLVASGSHRKSLGPGKTYTFGLAVHDGDAEGRFHRVSFEHRFEIEGGNVRVYEPKP
jgi:cytochrome c-type protein NapC